jgi:hypothetical protein
MYQFILIFFAVIYLLTNAAHAQTTSLTEAIQLLTLSLSCPVKPEFTRRRRGGGTAVSFASEVSTKEYFGDGKKLKVRDIEKTRELRPDDTFNEYGWTHTYEALFRDLEPVQLVPPGNVASGNSSWIIRIWCRESKLCVNNVL